MSFGIPFGKNNEVAGTECQPLGSPADYVKQVPLSVGAMETMEGKQMHQSQPNQELDGASLTEVLLKAKRALRPRQSAASPSFTWDTATSGTLGRQTCFPIARPSIVPSLPCHTETAGWQMSYGSQQAITPETDHVITRKQDFPHRPSKFSKRHWLANSPHQRLQLCPQKVEEESQWTEIGRRTLQQLLRMY